jgi:hypothetical protein
LTGGGSAGGGSGIISGWGLSSAIAGPANMHLFNAANGIAATPSIPAMKKRLTLRIQSPARKKVSAPYCRGNSVF